MSSLIKCLFLLNFCFSVQVVCANLSKNLVFTNPYGGLGDVFSAIKTAIFLASHNLDTALFIDTSGSNSYLQGSAHLSNAKKIAEDKNVAFISSESEAFDYKPTNLFVVTGKTLRQDFGAERAFIIYEYNQKSLLSPSMFAKNIPVIEIESGFDKNGIFTLEQEKIDNIVPINTWAQINREKLQHLPPKIQNMLAEGQYYFGYANGRDHGFHLNAYIAGVARHAIKENQKDLVFFLAGDVNKTIGYSNLFDFIDEDEFATCSTYSISGQRTYENRNEEVVQVEQRLKFDKPDGLNLYIIRGRVDNDDFLALLKGSQYPFALVTGDQSLSEALSLGKVPIYQTLSHKTRVIPGLVAKMSPIDRELANIIDNLTLRESYKDNSGDMAAIAEGISLNIGKIMPHQEDYREKIMRVTKANNLLEALLGKLSELGGI